jgi:secreted trypsin-like serine protease
MLVQYVLRWVLWVFVLLAIVLGVVALAVSQRSSKNSLPPVIGGVRVSKVALPSMAYLIYRPAKGGVIQCSGTVVAPKWVLTAGHCGVEPITGRPNADTGFEVFSNSSPNPAAGLKESRVSKVVIYPGYGKNVTRPDVALLFLTHAINAPAIELGSSTLRNAAPGDRVVIVGWTTNFREKKIPTAISLASTVIQAQPTCSAGVVLFDPRIDLCTFDPPRFTTGICEGDSGGPLVRWLKRPVEIGIASRAVDYCSTRRPTVYTRIDAVRGWIAHWTHR